MEIILTNARFVTRDEIVRGTLQVREGFIDSLDSSPTLVGKAIDCEGDLVLPGLVELHTDNLEKNIQPRPGVIWPSMLSAALAHDSQVIGAGITTVFDAIAIGGWRADDMRPKILSESLEAIRKCKEYNLFKAEHLVHLRCELGDERMDASLEQYGHDENVRMLSIMDHTPGQRQWSNIDKWRLYHREKKWTDEEADAIIHDLRSRQQRYATSNRSKALAFARSRNLPVASHDDTTIEDCEQAMSDGVIISEFPTTFAAAQTARSIGMAVVMGAPNAIRGESHSGNVSARMLAKERLLDGLSSDYVPASLLHSSFLLASNGSNMTLPEAVRLVSANNASVVGLDDRGEIAPGKRADLLRVKEVCGVPVIRKVWRQGVAVA